MYDYHVQITVDGLIERASQEKSPTENVHDGQSALRTNTKYIHGEFMVSQYSSTNNNKLVETGGYPQTEEMGLTVTRRSRSLVGRYR